MSFILFILSGMLLISFIVSDNFFNIDFLTFQICFVVYGYVMALSVAHYVALDDGIINE